MPEHFERDRFDVPIFQAGTYPDEVEKLDDGTISVVSEVTYTPADVDALADNINAVLASGQKIPIVEEHDAPEGEDPGRFAVGWVGRAKSVGGKLYAHLKDLTEEMSANFDRLLGRSVEITKTPEAFNYRGITGPLVKRLALLTKSLPRIKTLDSATYAELPFSAWVVRGVPDSSALSVCFAEAFAMNDPGAVTAPAPDPGGAVTLSNEAALELLAKAGAPPEMIETVKTVLGMKAEEPKPDPDPTKTPEELEAEEAELKKKELEAQEPDPGKKKDEAMGELARTVRAQGAQIIALNSALGTEKAARTKSETQSRKAAFAELHGELSIAKGEAPAKVIMDYVQAKVSAEQFSEGGAPLLRTTSLEISAHFRDLPRVDRAGGGALTPSTGGSKPKTKEEAEQLIESGAVEGFSEDVGAFIARNQVFKDAAAKRLTSGNGDGN